MRSYDHRKIEKKWQKEWEASGLYRTDEASGKEKTYVLDMFPYPSGEGLHVGHPKGYIATDIYSRLARMQGKSVLHPMGWDAFGLPAENYAIKNKVHPRVAVEKNVARFKEQLKLIGLDYDWNREINTTDPAFYKWTQWIFLKLHEKGLAYESFEPINWCPSCQTGLANEDLEGNACERCGTIVEQRPMRQWILKITDYAERLLQDLELLPEWQSHIKESQRNWIGKSEGAEIAFELAFDKAELNENRGPSGEKAHITVFTTRADTLFGATFLILSPEHPWVQLALRDDHAGVVRNQDEVRKYVVAASKKTEIERQENKEKTGVKLEGVEAINPATGEKIPLYVADYVLAHYGTGAIMAVPAHDERDFEFANKFNESVREVVVEQINPRFPDGVFRNIGIAVIENSKGEILMQSVTHAEGVEYSLPGGGIDDGETEEQGVLREVREETGYTNFASIQRIGQVEANYFKPIRNIYRQALATAYALRLKDEHQEATEFTELEKRVKIENFWVSKHEALELLSGKNRGSAEDLPLFQRYIQGDLQPYVGEGILINSGEYNNLTSVEARTYIAEKFGTKKTTYKLRDWVFSRQRYWGEPIPMVHCENDGTVPVPYEQLPVTLPEVEHYEPTGTGESPLAAIEEWVQTTCPKCGGPAKRETNTMPQWAGSSWYYLRYMDPANDKALVDPAKEKFWSPVDLYVGGAEHATRHLIYARFWHKFLFDIGVVASEEPFTRLISVGLIQAEDGRKMSKRYGNVINPDDIVETYGADTLRIYEMFMGPFTDAIAWKTASLIGARRFVERMWKLGEVHATKEWRDVEDADLSRILHQTIKKVGEHIHAFKFNTAISQMMIFLNAAEEKGLTKAAYQTSIQLLAPFAPHIAEDIWHTLGNTESVHLSQWPLFDADKIRADSVTIVVQINGKVRAQLEIPTDSGETEVRAAAEQAAAKWLEGATIRKAVYVPNRLISFVLD